MRLVAGREIRHLDADVVRPVGDDDARRRTGRVLAHICERLLYHAVGHEVHAGRQLTPVPHFAELDVDACRPDIVQQVRDAREPG